jgi:two-component system, NarL family, invasion response regulator UvrY
MGGDGRGSYDERRMRVLIVDDHAVVRRGVRELIVDFFPDAECAEAKDGEEALELVRTEHFDLGILDVSMPNRGGIDVLEELHERAPQLSFLVLSHHAEELYAVRALRAGARGYLTKSSAPEELVYALREILAGGKYVSVSIGERVAGALAVASGVDSSRPAHDRLSDRELEVLRLLAAGKAIKEIAAELTLSGKTVTTYRSRLLEKMDMKSNAELMRYALRVGLVD